MAEIIPFRGILYNTDKINNLADVVAPPFDVISKQEQNEFHENHPQNIIRLTLGKTTENDTPTNNRYTRSADCFNNWLSEDIIEMDKEPAFYLTSMEFFFENKWVTRYGLIALIRLEPFEKGIVLPHEKTFSNRHLVCTFHYSSSFINFIKHCYIEHFCATFNSTGYLFPIKFTFILWYFI